MSRSYKKFPKVSVYYGKSGKFGRRRANKKIRNLSIDYYIPNGGSFKKLYESCNICDYSFTQFKEWEIQDWETEELKIQNGIENWRKKYHGTLKEALQDWKKLYLRK